ncbi:MAG TPA: hypothetical protein VN643_12475 [Pyrinomonadaceae bacterium]|nr:hypothetical protein [Pyrinomonadaceae bacterium]
MKDCLDEGTLQSYFDGELSIDMMEKVSSHLTACLTCKREARELEAESLILSEALEPEFAMSVPTERLRARIDAAVAERSLLNPPRPILTVEHSAPLARRWWDAVAELFAVSPQRAFAYAGVAAVILVAITFAFISWRSRTPQPNKFTASGSQPPKTIATPAPGPIVSTGTMDVKPNVDRLPVSKPNPPRYVQAKYSPKPANRAEEDRGLASNVKLLPGERGYLKTIAALDSSIKSSRNKPMRPALQSEYERNLAMVDRAIAATRNAAKSNPNDPDAAEFMYAAYQTKVDLLNQVADARLPNRQQ